MGKGHHLQSMVLGKLDIHVQNSEIRPLSHTLHRGKSKWFKHLNVRPESINLLEENIGKNFQDLGFSTDFLDRTPKALATKTKINK